MAVDLNVDVGELIKNLVKKKQAGAAASGAAGDSGALVDKIVFYKGVIIFGLILAAATTYFVMEIYMPGNQKNIEKQEKLADLIKKKQELEMLKLKAKTLRDKLNKSREHYLEELSHFGNSEDLGELYQSVSKLATKYNLIVLNIKEVAMPAPEVKKDKNGEIIKEDTSKIKAKEIKVDVELKGRYTEYMMFKEDLSIAEMLLNINSETIQVGKSKVDKGMIYTKLNISTYAIDKSAFREVIPENDK